MAIPNQEVCINRCQQHENQQCSIFDVASNFFDFCHILSPVSQSAACELSGDPATQSVNPLREEPEQDDESSGKGYGLARWSCNTCRTEFRSLLDQRSHFKSDIHLVNVKLSISGKCTSKVNNSEATNVKPVISDCEIASVSGSEDDVNAESAVDSHANGESSKQRLSIRVHTGEIISLWMCLFLNEFEKIAWDNDTPAVESKSACYYFLRKDEVLERLKALVRERRDNTKLRVILLVSGGHFTGCVYDGNKIVAHKTFHRYIVRAKSGKKQSSNDACGRAAFSAGASLRRHNEHAFKKEIQDLLLRWKSYLDRAECVFIYAPSNNRQLFSMREGPLLPSHLVRRVPITVWRPTLKEARRIYYKLTQIRYEAPGEALHHGVIDNSLSHANEICGSGLESSEKIKRSGHGCQNMARDIATSMPLGEASMSGNELLNKGVQFL